MFILIYILNDITYKNSSFMIIEREVRMIAESVFAVKYKKKEPNII